MCLSSNLDKSSRKRKVLEEVKKSWKANSTLWETDWSSHYFMDPVEGDKYHYLRNRRLLLHNIIWDTDI
ncbi:hypothetical protein RclHR1_01770021 [Rhizophagus clarus]|uniref:Uncharacterized protein n=1 Tax=Rhizophagus clarus TaxID=94130 RepID=A0A2Z6QKK0_9GLOM|nr:hypothetical protein RclHR1_01770021 [Rhizophagus clarus]